MAACTFFGHRDCPSSIKPKLCEVLIDQIENHAVDMFYVGQQGAFDAIVRFALKELVSAYPHINYAVVLERLPPKRDEFGTAVTPILSCRKASKPSIPASQSRGATSGCLSNPTMS